MGNLLNNTFEEIWNGIPYQKLRRQMLTGENIYQSCTSCTRGIRFMHLQKTCAKILAEPEMFKDQKFTMNETIPDHIMRIGVVRKVLGP